MPDATPQQIQAFSDQRARPHCELARQLVLEMLDDISEIGDVYSALTDNVNKTTWTDNRTDGVPHLAVVSDLLAYNSFMHNITAAMQADPAWPVIQALCVREVAG